MSLKKPFIKFKDDSLDLNFECDLDENNYGALDQQINDMKREIEACDNDIYRLKNHAGLIEYSLSAASGALAGFLDIVFTKNLDFTNTNSLIQGVASNLTGTTYQDTNSAINALNSSLNGNASLNNLKLASQASLFGLVFSVIGALTGTTLMFTRKGQINEEVVKPVVTANLFSGVFYGTISWICELISNHSNLNANIPLGLKSLVSEASECGLKLNGNELYNAINSNIDNESLNTISNGLNAMKLLGSQALVVGINEVIVRAIYFIKEFFNEIKEKNVKKLRDFGKINYKRTIPFNNRTVARMITVSLAVMMTIDICDASIEASIESQGNKAVFASNFMIRINFVGVGRIILAISNDVYMGFNLKQRRKERIGLINDYSNLLGRKIYTIQDDVWKECHTASELIESVKSMVNDAAIKSKSLVDETKEGLEAIGRSADKACERNDNLKEDIKDILKWE